MVAHATTATEHEVDSVNAVDVEDRKWPNVSFRVGAGVMVLVSKLNDVSNFSETATPKKTTSPFLERV